MCGIDKSPCFFVDTSDPTSSPRECYLWGSSSILVLFASFLPYRSYVSRFQTISLVSEWPRVAFRFFRECGPILSRGGVCVVYRRRRGFGGNSGGVGW